MAQFRRSKSFGPVRLTFSNRGVSTSVGAGPLRFSRAADGTWRRTVRVSGTGISDTKKIGQSRQKAPRAVTAVTIAPAPAPGWYPDPAGSAGTAYWNGNAWGGGPPKPPTRNRGLIIGGSVALCFLILILIGNCSGPSDSSRTSTVTSTVTRTIEPPTVTVTAQPPMATITETAPPSTVTETAQAAPPLFVESTPVYAPPLVDVPESSSSAYYSNCTEARAAGAAPLYAGEPGYRSGLDRDDDGVACE